MTAVFYSIEVNPAICISVVILDITKFNQYNNNNILWLFFISLATLNMYVAFVVFVIASLIIAKLNLTKSLFVMIYCLLFPFLHLIWAKEVIINYQKLT